MPAPKRPDFIPPKRSKEVVESDYLFVDLTPASTERMVLVCAGRELCSPEYHLQRNGFRYYAIELVASGQWELEHQGVKHQMGPGSLFAYSPDTVFTLRCCSQDSAEKYFIDFSGSAAMETLNQVGLAPGVPIVITPSSGMRVLFDQILDSARYPLSSSKQMGELLLRLLMLRIEQDGRVRTVSSRDSYETYQRCRDHIRSHFIALNSVEEISDACHVDRAYMSRLFKRHAGESPYQLLTRMKMEFAAERLRSQFVPVKVVAVEVGYEDPLHFSRVFKKCFGISPKHYVTGR